ncbi:hypothetical protein SB861_05665 [Paraburkholderia sp. SIMBA_049]
MKPPDAASWARSAVAVVALSTALSGCYYYAPYDYVPYGDVPTAASQPYPFTMPDEATSGTVSAATASTATYVATAAPVFVEPAYYPGPYPYYGWPWWRPSVSLSFGYWGGCCYHGGHHGYWGHGHGGWGGHGYWGHGQGGGWAGHGGWTGHGYRWRGGGGGGWGGGGGSGGHYWGGGARHGSVH